MLSILGYSSAKQSSTSSGNTISSGLRATSSGQLSPFAQMLSELQQLGQSNPTQYSQVSQQISTNLSAAATNAQTHGHATLASQLTTLSKDFATASQTGQMPNVSDLAKVMAAGHYHLHSLASPSTAADSDAATTASATAAAAAATTSATHHGLLNFVEKAMSLVGV